MKQHPRRGWLVRNANGPAPAEAFVIIAVATILITRLYLQLTGYPQVGGGNLHIAHALYGGALMMLALLFGWLLLGFGARLTGVVMGGIGLGLFLDEVGKFVTKTNNYFYGPATEIMYILIVFVLVATRVLHDIRPPSPQECLASATAIAADGLARDWPTTGGTSRSASSSVPAPAGSTAPTPTGLKGCCWTRLRPPTTSTPSRDCFRGSYPASSVARSGYRSSAG